MYLQNLSLILVLLGAMWVPAQRIIKSYSSKSKFRYAVQCAIPTVYNLPFYDYGCSCIFGGTDSQPVDEFDKCCQVRKDCHSEVEKMGCFSRKMQYHVYCENEIPKCAFSKKESNGIDCAEKLRNCDIKAALCFKKHYHS